MLKRHCRAANSTSEWNSNRKIGRRRLYKTVRRETQTGSFKPPNYQEFVLRWGVSAMLAMAPCRCGVAIPMPWGCLYSNFVLNSFGNNLLAASEDWPVRHAVMSSERLRWKISRVQNRSQSSRELEGRRTSSDIRLQHVRPNVPHSIPEIDADPMTATVMWGGVHVVGTTSLIQPGSTV